MQSIDLRRIMNAADLKASFVGAHLFPDNVNPASAIHRVCRGEALLNSDQVAKLAELVNVPVGILYDSVSWGVTVPANSKNLIQFRAFDYYAELDLSTMATTVSRNGVLFFEKVTHDEGVKLSDYLSQLKDLIIKHK